MKKCLFILLVCCVNLSHATTYYFSSSTGNDSRSSTQAKSSSTPWKSIDKLNSFFSSLQPGDFVLFKRGETFYGSITVNKSGSSGKPITIGAYGTGNRPIITSFVSLSGWTKNSSRSGVYDAAANSSIATPLNMVTMNDVGKGMGRYPNRNSSNQGYLTVDSHVTNVSITDKQLPSSPNWKGAELVLRSSHWTLERCLITSHSGTKITYKSPADGYNARDKYGYFIQNSLQTLDQLGEWYYNPSTKKLSVYFGSSSPSSYSVKAAGKKNLVYSISKSYVVFDNITFKGANAETIYITGGSSMVVQNCDIIFSGSDGVYNTSSNFRIENCTVLNSHNDGVGCSRASYPIIRNNIIRNSFYIPGMGASGNGMGIGVKNGGHGMVEYNQIINSGWAGVSLGGDYAVVKNNLIDTFCVLKDDAGGIYTANGGNSHNTGRKIIGNILLHSLGAATGTDNTTGVELSNQGMYMDDNINGVEITGNTVAGCSKGIFLHNSYNIVVKDNTIYDNDLAQLYMKHDDLGVPLRNHTVTNNIFIAKTTSQLSASFSSTVTDLASIGTLDYNYYARPMDDKLEVETITNLYKSNQVKTHMTLSSWKSKYGKDPHSKGSPKTYSSSNRPDDYLKFVYNASKSSKSIPLSGTYIDVKGKTYSKSITLLPYASAVLMKTSGSSNAPSATTVSLTSPSSNSTFNAPATIYLSADASSDNGISKVEFYNGTKLLATQNEAPYGTSWSNVPAGTYKLTAVATDNGGTKTTSDVVTVTVSTAASKTIASANNAIQSNVQPVQRGSLEVSGPGNIVVSGVNNSIASLPPGNNLSTDGSKLVDFTLYPNPAKNTLNIAFDKLQNYQKAYVLIQNVSGSTLKKFPITISGTNVGIDISSLSTGVYVITLSNDNFKITKRFIKVNN